MGETPLPGRRGLTPLPGKCVLAFSSRHIDQLYPQVGKATLSLLTRLGHEVAVPTKPLCCGQPMSNSGYANLGAG